MSTQLIVSGSIALDRIMNFAGHYTDLIHPEKLHVLSISILLDKLEDTKGGTGANIAYNAALLGDQPILLGSVGQDAMEYMKYLFLAGVNTEFIHYSNLATASFNVMTDLDDNQVGGFYPGAMTDSQSLTLAEWKGKDVFVSVSAHDPTAMRRQTDECKELGIRLFYDPGQQVSNVSAEDLKAGVEAAELLIVNDYELGALCKKIGMKESDLKSQIPIVITTFGKDGSVIEGNKVKSPISAASAKPDQVVDPTGAGDAFRAGFLYGYLRDWELQDAAQLGSTVASFIVEKHGTQVELTKDMIMKRYKTSFDKEISL